MQKTAHYIGKINIANGITGEPTWTLCFVFSLYMHEISNSYCMSANTMMYSVQMQ